MSRATEMKSAKRDLILATRMKVSLALERKKVRYQPLRTSGLRRPYDLVVVVTSGLAPNALLGPSLPRQRQA